MKLGATISSERGKPVTKTGNEFVKIEIQGEDKQNILFLKITPLWKAGELDTHTAHIILSEIKGGQVGRVIYGGYIKTKSNGNLKHGTLCNCGMNAGFHKKQSNCK